MLPLVEMGLPEDLRAEVLTIEPCPPIAEGPGKVVLKKEGLGIGD